MKSLMLTGIFAMMFLGFIGCEKEQMISEDIQYASILKVAEDGTSSVIDENLKCALVETPELAEGELDILLEMKQEEKLAHDVYVAMFDLWGSKIFSNISFAEERHLNAVIRLLEFYGSEDILIGEPGVFGIEEFQTLYNDMIAAGSVSAEEALKVGALIEEMDIQDLTEALDVATNHNIIMVFENLLKASRNHLRAFNRELTKLGVVYVPLYISQEEFDQIVNTAMETGKKYRMNRENLENWQERNRYRNGDCDGKAYNYGADEGNEGSEGAPYGELNGADEGNEGSDDAPYGELNGADEGNEGSEGAPYGELNGADEGNEGSEGSPYGEVNGSDEGNGTGESGTNLNSGGGN